jgi:hypothetical protein
MGTVNATAPSTAADRLFQLDIADSSLGDGFACQEEKALDVPGRGSGHEGGSFRCGPDDRELHRGIPPR